MFFNLSFKLIWFDSGLIKFLIIFLLLLIYLDITSCKSNFLADINRDLGLYYGSATDVCIDRENILYFDAEKRDTQFYDQFYSYYHGSWYWFNYRVYYKITASKMYFSNEEGIWLASANIHRQIFHFLDNFISLYYLYNYSFLPPVNTIIAPKYYPLSDYDYSYLTYKFLTHKYKPKLKEINGYDFGKLFRKANADLICFCKINFIFRVRFGFFGCFFKNYKERVKYRDSVFDYLKIDKKYDDDDGIKIGFIHRSIKNQSRNIVNSEMIIKYLKSLNYHLIIISFEKYNPVQQIKIFKGYNIILSSSGSGLLNMLWLGRNIVIIECFNYFFIHSDLAYEALSYGFSHISLFSTQRLYPKEHYEFIKGCYDYPYTFSNTRYFLIPCDPFNNVIFDDLYINLKEIVFSIEYGIKYVKTKLKI